MEQAQSTIDLHMHSTASDGTDTIPELLQKILAAGIQAFSVTDHDTIAGAMEMQRIVPEGVTFLKGIEFSCITPEGKCHILGYRFDETAPAFQAILEEGRRRRQKKLERRLAFLKEQFGISFSAAEEEALRGMNSVGKPHLGNLLAAKGFAADKNEAIEKYINPCKTGSDRLDGAAVVGAILAAGGVPVWAHPLGGTGEKPVPRQQFARQLALLKGAGLQGLECWYSLYQEEQVDFLLEQAWKNGLLVSGGSDYHGRNKPVALGQLNAFGQKVPIDCVDIVK